MQAADPERNFIGSHLCATGDEAVPATCACTTGGQGLRNREAGAVHRAQRRDDLRPRVGDEGGPREAARHRDHQRLGPGARALYWFAAQTLAKAGYVVLTSDPQGQGQSDERGEAPDENEGSPAQTDGGPFYDGTEDALDFFLSTPKSAYKPRPELRQRHEPRAQAGPARAAGLNAAYNPLWQLLNPNKIGLAGHSFGAAGVSFVGQKDPRVSAIVAWDNLGRPGTTGGLPVKPCPADPASHADAPITKPALGMSADYGLTPQPNTGDPDPLAKSQQSLAYSQAGVDTGELVIRGGTHYEFSFIPNPRSAERCAAPTVAWYTTAWFDKYVKGDSSADKRLLTTRWQPTRSRPRSTRTATATCSRSTTVAARHRARRRRAVPCEDLRSRLRRNGVERRLDRRLLVPGGRELAGRR